jgi:hypothetical protein
LHTWRSKQHIDEHPSKACFSRARAALQSNTLQQKVREAWASNLELLCLCFVLGNDVTQLTSSLKLNSPSKLQLSPPSSQAITTLTTTTPLQLPVLNISDLPHNQHAHKSAIMARGNAGNTKVFYQGSSEGFVIFVESEELVRKWKEDKSIPMTEVVAGYKIFTSE